MAQQKATPATAATATTSTQKQRPQQITLPPPPQIPPHLLPLNTSTWTEVDFIRALASLERLQDQLSAVRRIPANLIAPFRTPALPRPSSRAPSSHTSRRRNGSEVSDAAGSQRTTAQVFSEFNAAAREAGVQIQEMKKVYEDAETGVMIKQCSRLQSSASDAECVKRMGVGIWGWCEREREMARSAKSVLDGAGRVEERCSRRDEEGVVDLFQGNFKACRWEEEGRKLVVSLERVAGHAELRFEVQRESAGDAISYEVLCIGEHKDFEAITRCLYTRERKGDIIDTVEMLAAYGDKTLARASCRRCGLWRNESGAIPWGRRNMIDSEVKTETAAGVKQENQAKANEIMNVPAWIAIHEDCL